MKNPFSLNRIKKNPFSNISDEVFDKFVLFSKNNSDVLSLQQVFEKIMILDFVLPLMKKSFNDGRILEKYQRLN